MLKRCSAAIVLVLIVLSVPAFGSLYTFEIDETKSSFNFMGGVSKPKMEGTFSLELGGNSPTWSGNVELESVNAWNVTAVNLLGYYHILAGNLKLTDFDEGNDDSGSLAYNAGTHIATGIVNTEVAVDIQIVEDPNHPLLGWQGPFDWTVSVSDDNYLGSKEPGWTPEAKLYMEGLIIANEGTDDEMEIPYVITLVGASAVPEPATWVLMGLGMVGLVAVARRKR
jgi:hypothetical protein